MEYVRDMGRIYSTVAVVLVLLVLRADAEFCAITILRGATAKKLGWSELWRGGNKFPEPRMRVIAAAQSGGFRVSQGG